MRSKIVMISNAVLCMILTSKPRAAFHFERINDAKKNDDALLLFTGAKAYHIRGGLWRISGYADDGNDVKKIFSEIREVKEAML